MQQQFPTAKIRSCFFHFIQYLGREIQNHWLQSRYSAGSVFAQNMKKLSGLAFVPEEDVEAAFEEVVDCQIFTEN